MDVLFALMALLQDSDVYVEKATGLKFADKVGAMARGEVTDYVKDKRPDLGVSINYHLLDEEGRVRMSLDVYAYDFGEKAIPDGTESDLVKKHFDQIKKDVFAKQGQPSGWHSVKHVSDGTAGLGTDKGAPRALRAEFENTKKEDGPKLASIAYLLGYKNRFLKIRVTYYADHKKQCEEELQKLLADLGRQMKPAPKK